MKIGFIGAGKAGFTLGKYFRERGLLVSGYYSRSQASAAQAAAFTKTGYFTSPADLLAASELLFLTVPDGEIAGVWRDISGLPIAGKIICHTSGSLTSGVFDGISAAGGEGYSLHPFFAISSKTDSYKEIHRAFFTLEGKGSRLGELKGLIESLGNTVYPIAADQKVRCHAAAVFLSNQVAAVAQIGAQLLADCGLDDEACAAALQTLFLGHCQKIAALGPIPTLTGPVERGDIETIQDHLHCLEGRERQVYALLSERLCEMAKDKHPARDYSDIQNILRKTLEDAK
ncbi:MAG: DUF2520 domain-containing protein [Oscillospiraceae bacterium]|nr:DUF2520 domain-containing protein [Oscillospiraceae bacterium]